jgi:hypothetical protein
MFSYITGFVDKKNILLKPSKAYSQFLESGSIGPPAMRIRVNGQ